MLYKDDLDIFTDQKFLITVETCFSHDNLGCQSQKSGPGET